MSVSQQIQRIERPSYNIDLFVPNTQEVQGSYFQQKLIVASMANSAQYLQLSNITSPMPDWNHLPNDPTTDVLLQSDINYDPEQLARFTMYCNDFSSDTLILLIIAKSFIESYCPFADSNMRCRYIHHLQQYTPIGLLLLKS